MGRKYNIRGFPNDLITDKIDGERFLKTEEGGGHISVPYEFTGNLNDYIMISPPNGYKLCIKGMLILGEGSAGVVKIKRSSDGSTLLPCHFSFLSKSSASNNLNLSLEEGENILITATDRGNSETFVGISYLECKI